MERKTLGYIVGGVGAALVLIGLAKRTQAFRSLPPEDQKQIAKNMDTHP